ncbi:thiol reductant ABC exporter subunit CydC [Tahibacter harae]|uniref:Thiol reductant ABC exporter subunit CydC n=1 Tax=Tahibacter harae TaxID=2963937 RepID=A0ABT1QX03_9GAMM|nr:thiol reductant ABC exporter subunit CydC [Tahibacter harae]MCQ4166805.1 thiol reductant ABC exporter subunit CydC [Tahibacter harae]
MKKATLPQNFNLAGLLRRQWPRLALALLLGSGALLAALALLAYSGHFITATALAGLAAAPLFEIFRPGAIIRFLALARTAGRYGERLVAHDAVLGLMAQLRGELYARLARLAPEPLGRWSDGDLLQRIVADVELLTQAPLRAALPLLGAVLVLSLTLAFLLLVDAHAGLAAALCLLTAAVAVPAFAARRSRRDGAALVARYAQRREDLVDVLRGLTTLLLCGAWPQRRAQWQRQDRAVIRAELAQRLRESFGISLVVLLAGMAAWSFLAVARPQSTAQAPLLAAAVLAAVAALEALAPVSGALLAWGRARAAAARIDALLQQEPAVHFSPASAPVSGSHAGAVATAPAHSATLPAACGAVQLRGVRYTYPGRRSGVIVPDLRLPAGGRLLVSGPSGAGKSTLAALLARLMDADSGAIELDGVDLRDYDEASLRQRVALQPQRPHLFAASLAENLRLADPGADEARLRAVLRAVALEEFLAGLPQGLDTPIGEYGAGLSGGEARRLALARTLLRPAALFVLDEPFEGLDESTRQQVAAGIEGWLAGASLVVISHQDVALSGSVVRLRLSAAQ